MKSTSGAGGTSAGLQRSCVGVATVVVRSNSPARRPLVGSRGWNGSWVTDGLIRYNHVRRLWARGVVKEVPESCSA
uniref:IDP248 n=1 Tax=Arundo donax TaxID=35708 RepID=A0A0A9EWA1_ARUDO